jgi:stage II sporulation protein D
MTEDALAVWGTDIPYLQATASPGEENAKHYIDTVTMPITEFMAVLSLESDETERLRIEKISYTAGGGIEMVTILGQEIKGTTLRKKLDLNSTAMLLSVVGDSVTITTKGNGHRVGMSQYGANAMALDNALYQEILKHYYTGVEIAMYNAD